MKICKVEGCENKQLSLGYCNKHYIRFRKYGDPFYTEVGREIEMHGMSHTSEYRTWKRIINRCYNKNASVYCYYGGRGITICDRWHKSFMTFFEDMGKKSFKDAQIDRINNDGNYEPSNCHWTTQKENKRNQSTTKLTMQKAKEIRKRYKIGGMTQTTIGLIYGVSQDSISLIVNNKQWV